MVYDETDMVSYIYCVEGVMAIMSFRFGMSDQMRSSYRRFFRVREESFLNLQRLIHEHSI